MREVKRSRRGFLTAAAAASAGCLGSPGTSGNGDTLEIGVGSWNYAEQYILGNMFHTVLAEQTDYNLFEEIDYGNNDEVFEGFTATYAYEALPERDPGLNPPDTRDFHVYPDYTGTMWQANPPFEDEPAGDSSQEQYEATREQMESAYDLELLEMAPFENSFEFAIEPETSETKDIETLSDIAAYVNSGNYNLTVAMQWDFYNRADGWPQLVDEYGFDTDALETWEMTHNGVELTEIGTETEYLAQGQVDIALLYTTDPEIELRELLVLEDDEQFWPYYNLVPVVASEVVSEEIRTHLNAVVDAIDGVSEMRSLNKRVIKDEQQPRDVARSFLRNEGVI